MPPKAVFIVVAAMMLIALADWPYGYYQLLRLVGCGAAAWIAFQALQRGKEGWGIAFLLIALVYNPIFRVSFERETWSIVNVLTAIVFIAALRPLSAQQNDPTS